MLKNQVEELLHEIESTKSSTYVQPSYEFFFTKIKRDVTCN